MARSAAGKRKRTRKVRVGPLFLGGGEPVRVQSMTKVPLENRGATLRQVRRLEREGCEIVRVAVPNREAVGALEHLRSRTDVPLVADIHFDHRLAIMSMEAGADKVRINPGNIGGPKKLGLVAKRAAEAGCSLRIGVNAGSLEKALLRHHGGPTPEALVASAAAAVKVVEEAGFRDIVLSLKASSVSATIEAYRLASRRFRYPLHLGVTEAGWGLSGIVKSAIGIGALVADGIGDTLRVSLTDPPWEEVKVAYEILGALGLRRRGVEIISCPTCGRCGYDLKKTASAVQKLLAEVEDPLTVAVMGCAVNGPGEAREADIGLAGGKGKGVIFRRGKVLKTVNESEMIQSLEETVLREIRERAGGKKPRCDHQADSSSEGGK
jgi:(E)-4-hydroxy-3-methylbut-2-enyl-diphosphate synthase